MTGDRPILVTGAAGMLGRDLADALAERAGVDLRDRAALDVTDPASVESAVAGVRGGVVVNAAAWTDVDGAESAPAEALAVNGTAVRTLAEACARHDVRLVHVSTDYVLSGDPPEPLTEDASVAPVNVYGRGKAVGERAVLRTLPTTGWVVRTEWLYGAHGPSFVRTMLRLAATQDGPVDVVDDQTGQPTWTAHLAAALVALADRVSGPEPPAAGVLHATSRGRTTWYGLACEVFLLAGADPRRVRAVDSSAFPRPARRPAWSVLGSARWDAAGLPPLPDWRDALHAAWPALVSAWPEAPVRKPGA